MSRITALRAAIGCLVIALIGFLTVSIIDSIQDRDRQIREIRTEMVASHQQAEKLTKEKLALTQQKAETETKLTAEQLRAQELEAKLKAEQEAKAAAEAKLRKATATTIPRASRSSSERSPVTAAPSSVPHSPATGGGAKAYIYNKESTNNPCAYNPGKSDCGYAGEAACGLGGAKPCSKMRDHCSMSDYACQDGWFTRYMEGRYGTWDKALAFHKRNNWW